jgi:alkylation response protein AidB-like acyl-CoA dehydrogenase
MSTFKAPLRDINFLLNEVFDFQSHYKTVAGANPVDEETVSAILEECGRYCEDVISPLNLSGDQEGCSFKDGKVTTPKGFKEAYDLFVQGGWQGLSHPEQYGGQGLPMSLNLIKQELMGTANWAFSMYSGLSLGAMNTIAMHGSEEIKNRYMPQLTEGRWAGTMCLTESHCGSDLGQIKTRAELQSDGSYEISGNKIFISSGEHDLTENIVHVVIARIIGAPEGTRGISLFVVPKFLSDENGNVGEFNNIVCTGIEHKMGINASATTMLSFEGAKGFLIGEQNKGLNAMFAFINSARIGNAVQGVAHAELAFQNSLAYAKERRSMRVLSGAKDKEEVADLIIHHADVRRMLMTQRAVAEGGRAMIYFAAKFADHMASGVMQGDIKTYEKWDDILGFYTPILKGFLTEMGLEAANHGIQIFGGHGYIRDNGMEQIARDARISTLYEGTTGIQGLDLLGRKVLVMTRGKAVRDFTAMMARFAFSELTRPEMTGYAVELGRFALQWNVLTSRLMFRARKNADVVSSAGVHYLMYSGYVTMAYFWAMQAAVAHEKLSSGTGKESNEFYESKIAMCRFYFDHLLPRTRAHADSMLKPPQSLTDLPFDSFGFH